MRIVLSYLHDRKNQQEDHHQRIQALGYPLSIQRRKQVVTRVMIQTKEDLLQTLKVKGMNLKILLRRRTKRRLLKRRLLVRIVRNQNNQALIRNLMIESRNSSDC